MLPRQNLLLQQPALNIAPGGEAIKQELIKILNLPKGNRYQKTSTKWGIEKMPLVRTGRTVLPRNFETVYVTYTHHIPP